MHFARASVLCVALMAGIPAVAAAQDAVVLSGGGSRGLAHVGVFLYLDERGIDPEIVVGNSMGAVFGALYAAGYDPDAIRDRAEAVGWNGMFRPIPLLSGPSQVIHSPMLSFDLIVPERRISRGVFGEWLVNRALVRLLFDANARARGDFDRLPRRYRALAADLETGDPVVLGRGDLARAVRASMAYPGLFAPVKWNDLLLIDGGIVDNLPTLEARALGAKRLIAVDVSRPSNGSVSPSPLAVVQRAVNLMQLRMHRDTVPPDVLIQLDINSNFSISSFPDDPAPIIDEGYEAASLAMTTFASSSPDGARTVLPPPDSIGTVVIEAPDAALAALVATAFAPLAGSPYDADAVLDAVDRVYRSGLVHGIWPRMQPTADSTRAPALHVLVDAGSPMSVSVAAGYDSDRGGRVWASLDGRSRLGRNPVTRTAAASFTPLDRWVALSARLHPARWPGPAMGIGANLQERTIRSFDDDQITNSSVWRGGGWLGLEIPTGLRSSFFSASLRGERIDAEDRDGHTAIGPVIRFAAVPPDVPFVGEPLLIEAEARWGSMVYRRFTARGSLTFDLPILSVAVLADVRAVSRNAPLDDWPALGDEHAIPGLRWGEDRDRTRAVVGMDAGRRVLSGAIRMRLRGGSVAPELDNLGERRWITGAELGIVWPFPLGVLQAGWGVSSRGDSRFTIDLGRSF